MQNNLLKEILKAPVPVNTGAGERVVEKKQARIRLACANFGISQTRCRHERR